MRPLPRGNFFTPLLVLPARKVFFLGDGAGVRQRAVRELSQVLRVWLRNFGPLRPPEPFEPWTPTPEAFFVSHERLTLTDWYLALLISSCESLFAHPKSLVAYGPPIPPSLLIPLFC